MYYVRIKYCQWDTDLYHPRETKDEKVIGDLRTWSDEFKIQEIFN